MISIFGGCLSLLASTICFDVPSISHSTLHGCSIARPSQKTVWYGGWASELRHQLKTVVNIPWFCWGFNHPRWGFRKPIHSMLLLSTAPRVPAVPFDDLRVASFHRFIKEIGLDQGFSDVDVLGGVTTPIFFMFKSCKWSYLLHECSSVCHYGGFHSHGGSQKCWLHENPVRVDDLDLGVHLF